MNFDMSVPFYENDMMKGSQKRNGDEADVQNIFGNEWNEENIDIEELLMKTNQRDSNVHQPPQPPAHHQQQQQQRPSVLDLSPKPQPMMNHPRQMPVHNQQQQQSQQQRPIHHPQVSDISLSSSPSGSPYNMPQAATAFSYGPSRMSMPQDRAVPMGTPSLPGGFYRPNQVCPPSSGACAVSPYGQIERKFDPNSPDSPFARSRKRSSGGAGMDKESDTYKAKRERNNVAVRKSREKKKMREQETENKVKELQEANKKLLETQEALKNDYNTLNDVIERVRPSLPPNIQKYLEQQISQLAAKAYQQ